MDAFTTIPAAALAEVTGALGAKKLPLKTAPRPNLALRAWNGLRTLFGPRYRLEDEL